MALTGETVQPNSGLRFDRLLHDLKELARIGAQPGGGITRRAY